MAKLQVRIRNLLRREGAMSASQIGHSLGVDSEIVRREVLALVADGFLRVKGCVNIRGRHEPVFEYK